MAGLIKCNNSGCKAIFSKVDDQKTHSQICVYREDKCRLCASVHLRKDSTKHVADFCDFRAATCEWCEEVMVFVELEAHKINCPKALRSCQYCGLPTFRKDKDLHSEFCDKKPMMCSMKDFGCEFKDKRQSLELHEQDLGLHFPLVCGLVESLREKLLLLEETNKQCISSNNKLSLDNNRLKEENAVLKGNFKKVSRKIQELNEKVEILDRNTLTSSELKTTEFRLKSAQDHLKDEAIKVKEKAVTLARYFKMLDEKVKRVQQGKSESAENLTQALACLEILQRSIKESKLEIDALVKEQQLLNMELDSKISIVESRINFALETTIAQKPNINYVSITTKYPRKLNQHCLSISSATTGPESTPPYEKQILKEPITNSTLQDAVSQSCVTAMPIYSTLNLINHQRLLRVDKTINEIKDILSTQVFKSKEHAKIALIDTGTNLVEDTWWKNIKVTINGMEYTTQLCQEGKGAYVRFIVFNPQSTISSTSRGNLATLDWPVVDRAMLCLVDYLSGFVIFYCMTKCAEVDSKYIRFDWNERKIALQARSYRDYERLKAVFLIFKYP